jgi:dTDP-4-dehydrorhamnose 3,5-epimerase
MCEMKIVQCLRGRIFDVAIDLRKDSATFLKWHGEILDEQNGRSLCIPRGFAHGFQSLTDNSETLYFTDQLYSPGHERIIHHADPAINITWPVKVTAISPKDKYGLWIDDNFEPIHLDGAV